MYDAISTDGIEPTPSSSSGFRARLFNDLAFSLALKFQLLSGVVSRCPDA